MHVHIQRTHGRVGLPWMAHTAAWLAALLIPGEQCALAALIPWSSLEKQVASLPVLPHGARSAPATSSLTRLGRTAQSRRWPWSGCLRTCASAEQPWTRRRSASSAKCTCPKARGFGRWRLQPPRGGGLAVAARFVARQDVVRGVCRKQPSSQTPPPPPPPAHCPSRLQVPAPVCAVHLPALQHRVLRAAVLQAAWRAVHRILLQVPRARKHDVHACLQFQGA